MKHQSVVEYQTMTVQYTHWRRSALNSAGALQGGGGEFRGIFTPFYTINFWGLCNSGGAHAPAAPPSSAPMNVNKPFINFASNQTCCCPNKLQLFFVHYFVSHVQV